VLPVTPQQMLLHALRPLEQNDPSFLIANVPLDRRASFTKSNGQAAEGLAAKFKTLTVNSPCTDGENACLNTGEFAQCSNGT